MLYRVFVVVNALYPSKRAFSPLKNAVCLVEKILIITILGVVNFYWLS